MADKGGGIRRARGWAATSVAFGLLSLPLSGFILGLPVGLLAITTGIVVVRRFRGYARPPAEKAFAVLGIVAASIGVLATPILSPFMVPAWLKANDSMALQDLRHVTSAEG